MITEFAGGDEGEFVAAGFIDEGGAFFIGGVDESIGENGAAAEGAAKSSFPEFLSGFAVPADGDTCVEECEECLVVEQQGGDVGSGVIFPGKFSGSICEDGGDMRSWSATARRTSVPTTVSEPWLRPGTGVFQRILRESSHETGGIWPASAMPLREGPRHHGQSPGCGAMGSSAGGVVALAGFWRVMAARVAEAERQRVRRVSIGEAPWWRVNWRGIRR